jgi:hypothetical protein
MPLFSLAGSDPDPMDTFFLFFHLVINPFYNKDKQVRDTGPGEPIVIYHRMKNISDSLYIYMYFLDFCASSISSNKSGKDMASLLQERLSKTRDNTDIGKPELSFDSTRWAYLFILHFMFLFSLFVFVSAASHYFRIWTGHYFSIWTGQVPELLF